MTPEAIWTVFRAEYLDRETPLKLNSVHTSSAAGEKDALDVNVYVDGELTSLHGEGNGPIAAFVSAHQRAARTSSTCGCSTTPSTPCPPAATRSRRRTSSARCATRIYWGVGVDANIVTASLKAVISAVNRAVNRRRVPHSGSLTVKVVPSRWPDRTSIRPPWAATIAETIDRPSPVPWIARSWAVEERKNRSEQAALLLRGMPMPVSVTVSRASPSSVSRDAARSVPPSSVNLIALLSRFVKHPLELDPVAEHA